MKFYDHPSPPAAQLHQQKSSDTDLQAEGPDIHSEFSGSMTPLFFGGTGFIHLSVGYCQNSTESYFLSSDRGVERSRENDGQIHER